MTHLAGDPLRCSVRVPLLAFTIRPNPGKSIHPKPLHWISEGKKCLLQSDFRWGDTTPGGRWEQEHSRRGAMRGTRQTFIIHLFFFRVYFVFVYIHSPTLLLFASISKGKYFLTHESINGGMDENNHSLGFLNDSITRTAISSSSFFFFNAGIEKSKKISFDILFLLCFLFCSPSLYWCSPLPFL